MIGKLEFNRFFTNFAIPWKESPRIFACANDKSITCSPQIGSDSVMNWITLIVAGFCEIGFTYCLGRAKSVDGPAWWGWIAGFLGFTILSMGLLAKATQNLPIGTAYAVWTGIGAVGTVLVGILFFHEPATFWRLFFIFTLISSIIGLKIVS